MFLTVLKLTPVPSEEYILQMFVTKVNHKTFGPKSDEVSGEWSILHNKELCHTFGSPSIVREVKSRTL